MQGWAPYQSVSEKGIEPVTESPIPVRCGHPSPDPVFHRFLTSSRSRSISLSRYTSPLSSVRPSRSIHSSIPIIGISGGVGSGKSTLIRHVSRLRLLIIDADRIAHELLADETIIRRIRETFGASVFTSDGAVDRRQLAELVFGQTSDGPADSDTVASRRKLEQIMHPAIHHSILERIQNVSAEIEAVILDAALLLEVGWANECDAVIFIDTPLHLRQQRVLENRNWSAEELSRREAAQWPIDQKKAAASFIVDNSVSVEDAAGQMERVLRDIINRHQEARSGHGKEFSL